MARNRSRGTYRIAPKAAWTAALANAFFAPLPAWEATLDGMPGPQLDGSRLTENRGRARDDLAACGIASFFWAFAKHALADQLLVGSHGGIVDRT
jgi:hypothetical protein